VADVRRLSALLIGAAATLVVPRRADVAVTASWLRLYRALAGGTIDRLAARLERHLPSPWTGEPFRALAERQVENRIEDMWGRLRGLRSEGYAPHIEFDGLEHVRRALERGRGVVVWCMRVGSATVIKRGFREQGLPLTHLSRVEHGSATTTKLGIGVVAPLFRRVEDAALAERVQIPLGDSLAYLQTLSERLAANACVSIFGEHSGRQTVEVEILGIRRRLALGAPSIAWRAEAGLVTAYALRESAFRHRVVIEEELPIDRGVPRRKFAEQAVRQFGRRLEACVLRHPAEWHSWFYSQ
jgi:lauroyl/myristoyl acyltransferase